MTRTLTTATPTLTLRTLHGHRITVFENDYIARKIAKTGLYEKENLELLARILRSTRHAVVLDVGANIGNHSLAFSLEAKQVYAFEPLPEVFTVLEENLRQNQVTNVRAFNVALSDVNGRSPLYRDRKGNIGASSFDRRAGEVEEVAVTRRIGDELVEELGLTRLDLVKIDVEAHEVYVLRGLMRSLEKFRPCIVMEWNDPLTIERLSQSEVLHWLFEQYEVRVLGSNHDRGYWKGRPFAFLRRKYTKFFHERFAALYEFNPTRLYKNLLLVPRDKARYLEAVKASIRQ